MRSDTDAETQNRKPWDDRGRERTDRVTSQGTPGTVSSHSSRAEAEKGASLEPSEGAQPRPHHSSILDFWPAELGANAFLWF